MRPLFSEPRVWSWAASTTDAEERRDHVARLRGQRLVAVRYFTIDYLREQMRPDLLGTGPRAINTPAEESNPTWRYDGFDSLDFGIEFETEEGELWSLTWDPPGEEMEGIGLRSVPMLGTGVAADADVAIWNVAVDPTWSDAISGAVRAVELHYRTWDREAGSLWCPRISIVTEQASVQILLGDCEHPNGELMPSADNVVVLHAGTDLPSWHSDLAAE